ncbi:Meh1p PWA37_003045 [Arxiozyma heterogenica]|uniref:Meh1p n=1 Tax=Arxiozyma heterogenica TaxID=278026 RepID=UPI002F13F985
MGVMFSSPNNLCCCGFAWGSSSSDPDEEALLRNQPYGYGTTSNGANGPYDAVQEQLKEHERRLQARDQELRGIVASTNDKLIDISMISNSGIVVQKSDLYTEDMDEEENDDDNSDDDNEEDDNDNDNDSNNGGDDPNTTNLIVQEHQGVGSDTADNSSNNNCNSKLEVSTESDTVPNFTILTEEEVTPEMKQTLTEIHEIIMDRIIKQIAIEAPQDLIVAF